MGTQTGKNNGGVIVFVPAGPGRRAETLGAGMSRRGETVGDTIARISGGGRPPRGARVLTLSGEDVRAYGGSRGFSDADINDIIGTARGRQLVTREARTVGSASGNRISQEETRAQANARNVAARLERATANISRLQREAQSVNRRRQRLIAGGASNRTQAVRTLTAEANRLAADLAAAREQRNNLRGR